MPSTSGMKGGGFYDANSSGQRAAIESLLSWIDHAAGALEIPTKDRPITLADYGCSEGANAILAIDRAVAKLRGRGMEQPVCAIFNDIATNNFNRLCENLAQAEHLTCHRPDFFPSAVPGSFYGPLLPPASVDFATSFNAVLWLDHLPDKTLDDFIVFAGPRSHRPEVNIPAAVRDGFAGRAAEDLTRFLEHRARELRPGARLVVATPGRDAEHSIAEGLYDLLHDTCVQLVGEGRIDREAYCRFNMPLYFRDLDEMIAPLKLGPLSEAFEIDAATTEIVATPFVVEYDRSGELNYYVERYVGFMQAFTEPVIRARLVPAAEQDVVELIYTRAKERLFADPERYRFQYIQVAMSLVRRAG